MKIHSLDFYVFPLEELRCGYGIQQGNLLPSLSHIPGRVIRGGLGGWALRTGGCKNANDSDFKGLFEQSGDVNISFPFCTYRGYRYPPLSLFEVKGGRYDPRTALVSKRPPVYASRQLDDPDKLKNPIDFLRRDEWPADLDATMKPVTDVMIADERRIVASFGKVIELRNKHDAVLRRVGEDGLFAEECLPPSRISENDRNKDNYYVGTLRYEDKREMNNIFQKLLLSPSFDIRTFNRQKMLAAIAEKPDPAHLVYLGRHRVPALIYGVDKGVSDANSTPLAISNIFTLTFLSDFVPISGDGKAYPLTAEMLQQAGLPLFMKRRAFCAKGEAHGFDVQGKKEAQFPMTTIRVGSCCLLQADTISDDIRRNLFEKGLMGMGRHRKDGFGRFEINWNIHDVEEQEVKP